MEATASLCNSTAADALLCPTASAAGTEEERIRALPPCTAISFGYTLYKAYCKPKGSCARREAREIVRDMKRVFAGFDPASPQGMYLLQLRSSAVSFANGIRRRKEQMNGKLKAARLELSRFREKYKRDQRLGYALSTGLRLLLLGGFTWALVKMLLLAHIFGAAPAGTAGPMLDPQYLSLSFALGTALVSAYWRGWTQDRTIGNALEKYEKKMEAAYDDYVEGVITEYRYAAHEAQTAWVTMTKAPAPTTPAFDALLLDLFCGHRQGFKSKGDEKKEEDEPRLTWKQRLRALFLGHK